MTVTLQDEAVRLRTEGSRLFREANPLLAKSEQGELNEDERRSLGELRGKIKQNVIDLKQVEDEIAANEETRKAAEFYTKPVGTPAARLTASGDPDAPKIDARSLGRRFVTSDAYQQYKASKRGNSAPVPMGGFRESRSMDDVLPKEGLTPEELRAVVYTNPSNLPGPPMRVPGIFAPNIRPLRVRDVMINGNTTSNSIEFVQETSYTAGAAETAEATSESTGLKPESALGFNVVASSVKTIATIIPVTRQMLEDEPQMETYINNRLSYFVSLREDDQLVKGDGSGANLTGILNTSGIQTLDATYFSANPLPTTGAAANNVDRLRRARTKIRVTGRAIPDAILIHPDDYEAFDEMKDSVGQYLLNDPRTDANDNDQNDVLWGLRIVETEAVNAGSPIVGAFGTMAAVWDRNQSQLLMTDSHSDWFQRNLLALMAEERLALTIYRPVAFAVVSLA